MKCGWLCDVTREPMRQEDSLMAKALDAEKWVLAREKAGCTRPVVSTMPTASRHRG